MKTLLVIRCTVHRSSLIKHTNLFIQTSDYSALGASRALCPSERNWPTRVGGRAERENAFPRHRQNIHGSLAALRHLLPLRGEQNACEKPSQKHGPRDPNKAADRLRSDGCGAAESIKIAILIFSFNPTPKFACADP